MSKVTLLPVGSLSNQTSAQSAINNNSEIIEDAFDNTITRDGSLPNDMLSDLDLGGNSLLNVADPVAETDGVNLRSVRPLVALFGAEIAEQVVTASRVVDNLTGDGGATYQLSQNPGSLENLIVAVDGVIQRPTLDYTLSGATLQDLVFDFNVAVNQKILVRYDEALQVGATAAGSVSYTPAATGVASTVSIFLDSLFTSVGGTFIKWLQAGTGAIARTIRDKLLEASVSAEEFGAVGDGVTDDSAAIMAAMTAAAAAQRTVVQLNKATYAVASTLEVPPGVELHGRGNGFIAFNGYAATTGTKLLWTGATGGGSKVVSFKYHNKTGGGMRRIVVDSDSKADYAIEVDGSTGLDFKLTSGFNSRVADLNMIATLNIGQGNTATTNSWNTFTNTFWGGDNSGACAIYLGGDFTAGNACHNTFVNTHINTGGSADGVVLANCDNNTFIDTYMNRAPGGTGYGVKVEPDHGGGLGEFPVANNFYHLQAGAGGWYQPADTVLAPATVWDYHTDNGQPWPVLNGTQLYFTNNFLGFMASELPKAVGAAGQPVFQNSWVNFGAPAEGLQFWKDRLGFVHITGMVKNGTINTILFTLPVGYRPTGEVHFPVSSNTAYGEVYVRADGAVIPQIGNNAYVSLNGVTFRADYPQS